MLPPGAGCPGEVLNNGERSLVLGLAGSYLRALSTILYPSGGPGESPINGERSVAFELARSNLRSLSTILYHDHHRHHERVKKKIGNAHPRMTSVVVIRLARRFE